MCECFLLFASLFVVVSILSCVFLLRLVFNAHTVVVLHTAGIGWLHSFCCGCLCCTYVKKKRKHSQHHVQPLRHFESVVFSIFLCVVSRTSSIFRLRDTFIHVAPVGFLH